MKNLVFFVLLTGSIGGVYAQVNSNIQTPISINDSGTAPDSSAVVDINAADKGLLIPRMTMAARDAISIPATGLMIYQTDNIPGFYYYDGTGWSGIGSGSPGISTIIQDADGDTMVQTEESPDEDVIQFYVSGTEVMTLIKNSSGAARLELQNSNNNIAVGNEAGVSLQPLNGRNNTFLGTSCGNRTTTGDENTGCGHHALYNNTTGSFNTATGETSLNFNNSGNSNTANGYEALYSNFSGNSNTAVGKHALYENTNRSNLVAVGDSSLYNNGLNATDPDHSTNNTGIGSKTLFSNTTGRSNTATGFQTMYSNTTGFFNTAFGKEAMYSNATGSRNTAFGYEALYTHSSGFNNMAIGYRSLRYSTGNSNTACGYEALFSIAGSNNTALGYKAGDYSTGENNTFIGANAEATLTGLTNATAIGYNARVAADNSLILGDIIVDVGIGTTAPSEKLQVVGNIYASGGDFYTALSDGVINCGGGKMTAAVNYIGDTYNAPTLANGDEDLYIDDVLEVGNNAYKPGGGSWLTTSDRRLKKDIKAYDDGLTQVLQISPVYFKYNDKTNYTDKDKEYVGIIAQDMLNIAPYMVEETALWQEVREDENGREHITKAGEPYYIFDPGALPYMLVNAVKEQQIQIEDQAVENERLKKENEALQNRLARLEASFELMHKKLLKK